MFHPSDSNESRPADSPIAAKKARTVAELANAIGISPSTLASCISRGCPRDSVKAIRRWRSTHLLRTKPGTAELADEDIPRYCFHPAYPPRAVAETMGRFLLEDSRSPLFKGIDHNKLRAIIANQVCELYGILDMSGTRFDRLELLADLGLSDVAPDYLTTPTHKQERSSDR